MKERRIIQWLHAPEGSCLGNRVPIAIEELVEYDTVINGIPDRVMRNEARINDAITREAIQARETVG
jgi:hypothetical protein